VRHGRAMAFDPQRAAAASIAAGRVSAIAAALGGGVERQAAFGFRMPLTDASDDHPAIAARKTSRQWMARQEDYGTQLGVEYLVIKNGAALLFEGRAAVLLEAVIVEIRRRARPRT